MAPLTVHLAIFPARMHGARFALLLVLGNPSGNHLIIAATLTTRLRLTAFCLLEGIHTMSRSRKHPQIRGAIDAKIPDRK